MMAERRAAADALREAEAARLTEADRARLKAELMELADRLPLDDVNLLVQVGNDLLPPTKQ